MTYRPIQTLMTPSPWTIGPDANISDAWELMEHHRIRHLPVVEDSRVVGILSERDLSLVKSIRGIDPDDVSVAETMRPAPFSVSPDSSVAQVARSMAERRIGSAVVVDENGNVLGIFTTTDALLALSPVFIEEEARH